MSAVRQNHWDGLRGLAAIVVLFGHIVIALFPTVVSQNPSDAHTLYDAAIGRSPLAVLWSVNFAVYVFFVVSAFVLSDHMSKTTMSFGANLVRRYLRLALPVLIVSVFAWALLRLGMFQNSEASEVTRSGWLGGAYHFPPSFLAMVKESIYGAFAAGTRNYNPNLVTMQTALSGSFYIFILFTLFPTKQSRLLGIVIFSALYIRDPLLMFAAGAFLFDWQAEIIARVKARFSPRAIEFLAFAILLLALVMGGVVAQTGPADIVNHYLPGLFRVLKFLSRPALQHSERFHEIGAIMLLVAVLMSMRIRNVLSMSLPVFLGQVSFTLYLIQIPIICSVMSWVVLFFPFNTPYLEVAGWAASITVVVTVALAWLFNDVVDVRMTALSQGVGRLLDRVLLAKSGDAAKAPVV